MTNIEEIDERKKIQRDLLWGLYIELRNQSRHSELLRANVSNYVLLISSALITIITFDKKIDRNDLFLGLITILSGIVGMVFSLSYTERYNRNRGRALELIRHLDACFFEGTSSRTLNDINAEADKAHYKSNSYLWISSVTNTHFFWVILPALITIIGLVLTTLSFLN